MGEQIFKEAVNVISNDYLSIYRKDANPIHKAFFISFLTDQ